MATIKFAITGCIQSYTLKAEKNSYVLDSTGECKLEREFEIEIDGLLDIELDLYGLPGTDWRFDVNGGKKVFAEGRIGSGKHSRITGGVKPEDL